MYCHLNVKTGSRSTGQSAAAKYDYISRDGRYSRARQDEVVHVESGSMPAFAASDARLYWAAADSHERSNGRLFRSLTAALPNSLDLPGRLALARTFAAHVTAGEMPYTLAVHAGRSNSGAPDNPHLHLVFSERVNDGVERGADAWFRRAAPAGRDPAQGGARKSGRTKPREWLDETRQAWATQMNQAFERVGVDDRVTAESHAAQLARARAAGDAAEEERLLLNPPSEHIGPAAKHKWEDRSSGAPEQMPDRYAEYERASAAAQETRLAHARDAAEVAEARSRIERLDAQIASLEAEQRQAEETARRRKQAAARREAQRRRDEATWKQKVKDRETALGLLPGGVELYLAHLADIDPKWNVGGNISSSRENIDAALDAAESDARRQERLFAVLTDKAAAARYQRELDKGDGRPGTADIDGALAPAEALQKRVSRLRELLAEPGGDAALFSALADRSPSWPHAAAPGDIERATGVATRSLDRRQPASWQHRVILEAEQQFPDAPAAAWLPAGERFDALSDVGRAGRRITRTLSARARALAIAAERPEPPPQPGLVKRLFEWVRERARKMLYALRPSEAAQHQERLPDRRPGGDDESAPAAATERERDHAGKLVAAAQAAASKWGDVPLATGTIVSAAESLLALPAIQGAHRAVLERVREAAPWSAPARETAALRNHCRGAREADADRRHQQAVNEWEGQSRTRRRLAGAPRREFPDPPSHRDLVAAREELTRVIRWAMANELDRLMPVRRPAAPPAAVAADRDQRPDHRPDRGERHVPGRMPDTRPARPPARRDRGHEPSR
ncbi:MAG: MobA/MobL family protein [Alphaproteobacteria bacterium]|nr:MobA/MobL family protein [Alphaproteobacteria bacterium]